MKWTEEKIAILCADWHILSKEEIIQKYPDFRYDNLRVVANSHGAKKHPDFIHSYRLRKLLNDTLYNWYWYGFIMGDGYISPNGSLKIALSITDIKHLEKLANYLDAKINIYQQKDYQSYHRKDTCEFSIRDIIYGKKLIEMFKITGKKTYNPCSLDCIKTDEQFLSFFIGYIDADGSIGGKSKPMIRIQNHANWLCNLELFKERLTNLGIDSIVTSIDKRGYANFAIYRQHNFKFLYNFAKNNNLPYLERKWTKLDYLK